MITSDTLLNPSPPLARPVADTADKLSVELYENYLPPFVEPALQQLYGNVFSSLAHQRIHGNGGPLNAIALREDGILLSLWIYRNEGRTLRVLNEGIVICETELRRFACHLFEQHPLLGAIRFHAVRPDIARLSYPYSRHECLEDMVLTLPPSADEYRAQMGKSTRAYINRYLNKLKRDFPDMQFELRPAHELDEGVLRHIIALNRQRMAGKGKVSINDDALAERIIHLATDCGLVGVLKLGDRIVAGTINYQVRDNYFLEVIAHDPAYNDYRVGTLCCYLTVCECIARAGAEYHFLWGQDEYKTRLLGKPRVLEDLVIYRSRMHQLVNADLMAAQFKAKCERRARMAVRALRQGDGRTAHAVQALLRVRRRLRGE